MLGVASRTIRRYTKEFADFLSPEANDPRRKRFTDDDIYVLQTVRDLYARRISPDSIRSRLQVKGVPQGENDSALALVPAIAQRFQQLEAYQQSIESRFGSVDEKLGNYNKRFDEHQRQMQDVRRSNRRTQILLLILAVLIIFGFLWVASQT